jgi:WD40 repeat protein
LRPRIPRAPAKLLATGSADETAKVWDAESGKELLTLNGRRGTVNSVAWSRDGKRLAAASDDRSVQVYAMDIRLLMGLTHQRFAAHPSEDGCKKYFHIEKCSPFPELSWW